MIQTIYRLIYVLTGHNCFYVIITSIGEQYRLISFRSIMEIDKVSDEPI